MIDHLVLYLPSFELSFQFHASCPTFFSFLLNFCVIKRMSADHTMSFQSKLARSPTGIYSRQPIWQVERSKQRLRRD